MRQIEPGGGRRKRLGFRSNSVEDRMTLRRPAYGIVEFFDGSKETDSARVNAGSCGNVHSFDHIVGNALHVPVCAVIVLRIAEHCFGFSKNRFCILTIPRILQVRDAHVVRHVLSLRSSEPRHVHELSCRFVRIDIAPTEVPRYLVQSGECLAQVGVDRLAKVVNSLLDLFLLNVFKILIDSLLNIRKNGFASLINVLLPPVVRSPRGLEAGIKSFAVEGRAIQFAARGLVDGSRLRNVVPARSVNNRRIDAL